MIKKRKALSGITIEKPKIILTEFSFFSRFFFYWFITALGTTGTLGAFYSAFSIPLYLPAVLVTGIVCSVLFTLIFLANKNRIPALITTIAAGGVLLYLFYDALYLGALRTINTVLIAYMRSSASISFSLLHSAYERPEEIRFNCTALAIALVVVIQLLLSWFLVRRKLILFSFLLTLPLPLIPLLYLIKPEPVFLAAVLLFWVFLLFNTFTIKRRTRSFKPGKRFYIEGGGISEHPLALLPLCVVLCFMLALTAIFPAETYQRWESADNMREYLVTPSNYMGWFTGGGLSKSPDLVDLTRLGDIAFNESTDLRVYSSNPKTEYLKSFVGSTYSNGKWVALTSQENQKLREILYTPTRPVNVQNLPYTAASLFSESVSLYTLTVNNIKANARCIYAPYGLGSEPQDLPGIAFVNDGYLRAENQLVGRKEYTLQSIDFSDPAINFVPIYDESEWFIQYYSNQDSFYSDNTVIPYVADYSFLEPEQEEFMLARDEYTKFVYETYTYVPEDLRPILTSYLKERGLTSQNDVWKIREYLEKENKYDLSPGVTPKDKDFIDYFINYNHKGYCVHFATAATMLFRALGVPARYAEGYTVSQSDFGNNGWAEVPDSQAHAWVELYEPNMGWTYYEVTPGANDGAPDHEVQQQVTTRPNTLDTTQPPATQPTTPPTTQPASATQPTGQTPSQSEGSVLQKAEPISTPMLILLITVAIVLLLTAAVGINYTKRKKQRLKDFRRKDNNKAVLAMYRYIEQLNARAKTETRLPEELEQVVLKARFSQHTVTADERAAVTRYIKKHAQSVKENLPKLRYLTAKFGKGLF